MSVTLNPMVTTNAGGTFFASSDGYVAGGIAVADAAALQKLRIGTVASGATALLYGGVGLTVTTVASGSLAGAQVNIATAIANLLGFAVWDQAAAGIVTPQSQAALYAPGQTMSFFSFGSGACIALPISNANATALLNVAENTQLSWDYTNQVVIPYTASGGNAGGIPGPLLNGSTPAAEIVDVAVGNSKVAVTSTNYAIWGAPNPGTGNTSWYEGGSVVVLRI
jgi:hypothetical protein